MQDSLVDVWPQEHDESRKQPVRDEIDVLAVWRSVGPKDHEVRIRDRAYESGKEISESYETENAENLLGCMLFEYVLCNMIFPIHF